MSPERGSALPIGIMQVEQAVTVQAPPRRVFEALTRDIAAAWWGPRHMYRRGGAGTSCWSPAWGAGSTKTGGDGAGALWATVTRIRPDEYLELTGPLGTRRLVVGLITFTLEPRGGPRSYGCLIARSARSRRIQRLPTTRGGEIYWSGACRPSRSAGSGWGSADDQGGKEARRSRSTGYFRGRASFPPPQLR